jgi:protein-S-isoprenylcysteine O-methyltransferase Ste14
MIERVHEHIITELQQNTRTDAIFIIMAILLNLIILAVNSVIASENHSTTTTIVMILFACLLVVINLVVIFGLLKGKQTRLKLIDGLLKMYKDQGVEGYYDASLLGNYNTRYYLFIFTVISIGLIAIIVPFVIR